MGLVDPDFIRQQCRFFDHMADLVDPRFYQTEREAVNPKYMKKAARLATKQTFKEQYKQQKRARLDPDAAATTTQLQQRQATGAPRNDGGDGAPGPGPGSLALGALHLPAGGSAPSREELLARLQQKLQAARDGRHAQQAAAAGNSSSAAQKAKDWRKQTLGQKLKQPRGAQPPEPQQPPPPQQQQQQQRATTGAKRKHQDVAGDASQPPPARAPAQQHLQQQQQQQHASSSGAGLVFNTMVVPDGGHKGHKPKKPSKEQLLRAAEQKQARLAAPGSATEAAADAWQSALSRARGERVLDDPKLLRRSLKKDAKLKEKHAKKWQERVSAQQEAQQARQDRRKDNLAARAQAKLAKKKQRREKKLLRAGFEGRKAGFIKPAAKKAS